MPSEKSLKDLTASVVKIAESYPKLQKDVKDIRDAVCGPEGIIGYFEYMKRSIDKIRKEDRLRMLTWNRRNTDTNARNLLSSTASINRSLEKILGEMKSMSIRSGLQSGGANIRTESLGRTRLGADQGRMGGILRSIEIMDRLRDIKLRDFIFTRRKMRNIVRIMSDSLNMFRMFKDKEEVDNTLGFVESSIDIVKKFGKISAMSKPAQWGESVIERIFLGKKGEGGLLRMFRKIRKHKKDIDNGKDSIGKIAKACGSMLLTSIILTGIAVTGLAAMAGALVMKGIVWVLIGMYKMLDKSRKAVSKGSLVLLLMSASILSFGLGLSVVGKAVKGISLKDVGIIIASLAGIGLAVAGIGLIALPIAIGSGTLLLMGASLGVFGLALNAWRNIDSKKPMQNIETAVGGLRKIFGFELGKKDEKKTAFQRLKGGLMDIAMGILNFGESFFVMGSLLLAGVALGMLYVGLKNWDRFNGTKASKNIESAVGSLKRVFGIGSAPKGITGKMKKLAGSTLDMGISLMQGSKAFVEMGMITVAVGMADMIRVMLIPWNRYNPAPAAKNIGTAVSELKKSFGLEKSGTGIRAKFRNMTGNLFDLASSFFEGGGVLAQMGTITLATGMLDIIKINLKPWESYDAAKPVKNIRNAVSSLVKTFGLDGKSEGVNVGRGVFGSMIDMGVALIQGGKTLAQMGTIVLATGLLDRIRENLEPWGSVDPSRNIANVKSAVDGLLDVFGMSAIRRREIEDVEDNGFIGRAVKFIKNVGGDLFNTAGSLAEAASSISEGGRTMAKISNILHATSAMFSVKGALEVWDNYNSEGAVKNISDTVVRISDLFGDISAIRDKEPLIGKSHSRYFEDSSRSIMKGLLYMSEGWKRSEILKTSEIPFRKTVDTINSVDMSKVSVMTELFKSFSGISRRPFDKFTAAVNKFSESSDNLIDALNSFNTAGKVTGTVQNNENTAGTAVIGDGVSISNVNVLADAIADAIKSMPINIENTMSDVRLVVNNEAGRRVVLTLEN